VDSAGSWRSFGQVFDDVAAAYDDVRPSYPAELVDAAMERGGLGPGSRVLEVGCGTGKLTELLAARGLLVDAVDPGPNMIEAARKRVGANDSVRFHVTRFEDVNLPEAAFAALFSATAFHWLDPEVAWRKAASHLEPGGMLALLTHIGLQDERSAEANEGFRALLQKHAPEVAEALGPHRDLETILAGVDERRGNASAVWDWVMGEKHGLAVADAGSPFADVDLVTVVERIERTADELHAHFRTTSLYFRIDPARRQAFLDDDRRLLERLGGTVEFVEAAVLLTARRA
jgi:ubiquinone/menaquinone biosynthesis C-methylase UbiE